MEACGAAHFWGREIGKLGHVQDLQVFVRCVAQCDTQGDIHPFLTENGVCKTVAAVTLARFNLDNGYDLRAREIALLANITDGAVWNASMWTNRLLPWLRLLPDRAAELFRSCT